MKYDSLNSYGHGVNTSIYRAGTAINGKNMTAFNHRLYEILYLKVHLHRHKRT